MFSISVIFLFIILLLLCAWTIYIIVQLILLLVSFKQDVPYVPLSRSSLRTIIRSQLLDNRHTIVDLGCGTGTILAALTKHYPDAKLIGVEKNAWVVRAAKLRCLFWRRKPTIMQGDMFDYSLQHVDAVVGFWVTDVMKSLLEKCAKECKKECIIIAAVVHEKFNPPDHLAFEKKLLPNTKKVWVYTRIPQS
ncbi:MAG TPA: class I SAM-dependent methyltransferase [Patescibacteria group bacterium]|nr:class I SAM-dependent methyltransferase [Patescibacteria group bacterium]